MPRPPSGGGRAPYSNKSSLSEIMVGKFYTIISETAESARGALPPPLGYSHENGLLT